jgi:hypothetical protein
VQAVNIRSERYLCGSGRRFVDRERGLASPESDTSQP